MYYHPDDPKPVPEQDPDYQEKRRAEIIKACAEKVAPPKPPQPKK